MKKLISLLLLTVMLLSVFTSCGEIEGIKERPATIPNEDEIKPEEIPEGVDPDSLFTVKLIYDEKIFTETEGIQVQWANATTVKRAKFDPTDNIARISGLDGDYSVTLYGLPEGYMYDANIYTATNLRKNIEIEIFEHIKTRGSGNDLYKPIEIKRNGVYTNTIKNAKQTIYYQFSPSRAGTYVIETICDITENEVNPQIDTYNGTFASKYFSETVDSGGSSSTYTRNARYVIEVDAQNIGADYTFAIKATHKTGIYPVEIAFLVRFAGSYSNPSYNIPNTVIIPDQKALRDRGYITDPVGRLVYPEVKVTDGVYLLDSSRFGLNEDDGVYHLYNEETGRFDGPVLYAKITKRHRFFSDYNGMEVSFAGGNGTICVEDPGNKALQALEDGTENYKLFIQGGAACSSVVGMEGLESYLGYASYINNSEGVYPVTPELKTFLQKFSVSQRYFNDGNGWAETTAEDSLGYRIYSDEEDQWLFACCYYI